MSASAFGRRPLTTLLMLAFAATAVAQVLVPRNQGTVLVPATRPGSTPVAQPAQPTAPSQQTPIQPASRPLEGPSAGAQQLHASEQVVCQGFSNNGQFATGRYGSLGATHEIYVWYAPVVPTRAPANNDGSGLMPGTCAYIDKPWPGTGSTGVLTLNIPQPGAYETLQDIIGALRTPNRYWRFYIVRNAQTGEMAATRFEEWRPASRTASAAPALCVARDANGRCTAAQGTQPLVGGKVMHPDIVQSHGLVRMAMTKTLGSSGCSGSLLNNRWVLTAAHCIEDKTAAGVVFNLAPNAVTATAAWGGTQTQTAAAIHSFRPIDIALIELHRPMNVQGATHGFRQPIWRDGPYRNLAQYAITFMGTGISKFARDVRDSNGNLTSQMPSSTDTRYRVGSAVIRSIEDNLMWYYDEANAIIAGGDSGGPSYAGDAVSRGLIGVHAKCRLECAEGKTCGTWTGVGPEPATYNPWQWVTKSTACADAPLEPVWPQIQRIMAERTPPEAPPMRVTNLPYGAVRYTHPTTTGEDGKRHYADGCVHFGSDCDGRTAALYFCRTQNRAKQNPVQFSLRRNVGASAIIAAEQTDAGRVCFGPGCGAFEQITCAGPEFDLARLQPAVPNSSGAATARKSAVEPGDIAIPARSSKPAITPATPKKP